MGDHPQIITLSDILGNALNNTMAAAESIMDAVDNAKNVGALTDGLTAGNILGSASQMVNISTTKTYSIKFDKEKTDSDKKGITHYTLDLYKNPSKLINPLTKSLRTIKINKIQVLSAGEIQKLMKELRTMWDEQISSKEVTLSGKVEGLSRPYLFHITITAEPEEPKDVETPRPPDKIIIDNGKDLYESIEQYIAANLEDQEKEQLVSKQPVIFDFIEIIFDILKPISKILEKIAHYLENYRINKAKCIAHARGNLHISLLDAFEKSGLAKLIDSGDDSDDNPGDDSPGPTIPEDTGGSENNPGGSSSKDKKPNFYTVRTYKFSTWLKTNLDVIPDKDSMAVIDAS